MFSKWCESSSLDGIIDWHQSRNNKISFIFWTFVMCSMSFCTIYFTYQTVADIINHPTSTNLEADIASKFEMPEILICFNGGLNVAALANADLEEKFIQEITAGMSFEFDYSKNEEFDPIFKNYLQENNMTMLDFVQKFAYSCSDMVEKSMREFHIGRCENTSSLYSSKFGKCHIFSNNGYQLYPGLDGGMRLYIKSPPNSFYELYGNLSTKYGLSNSFYISIDRHFKWITRRFLLVPANVKAEIVLSVKHYIRLAESNPCDPGENIYSSNTCFHRCYAEAYYNFCKCHELEYLDSPDDTNVTNICRPTDYSCFFYESKLAQSCQEKCRPKCEEWVYESVITYAFLEPKPVNQSRSQIWIGFNSMEYIHIEEVDAFTFHMSISNIGGHAGLWVGASIVTVIQAVYYLVISFCNHIRNTALKLRQHNIKPTTYALPDEHPRTTIQIPRVQIYQRKKLNFY